MAKKNVLQDLMSMMDEDMLKKLKSGDADVKVTKIVAKPEMDGEKDIMDLLREEGDETPMGEEGMEEEDYSELEPIRKRYQEGKLGEEPEEETPEGFEDEEDKDFLEKIKSRFKG